MKTSEAGFALTLAFVGLVVFASSAAAQSRFSQADAQAIINAKDWNRLLAYGQAWTHAEPNHATAWYVLARAYGTGLPLELPTRHY